MNKPKWNYNDIKFDGDSWDKVLKPSIKDNVSKMLQERASLFKYNIDAHIKQLNSKTNSNNTYGMPLIFYKYYCY